MSECRIRLEVSMIRLGLRIVSECRIRLEVSMKCE